MDDLMAIAIVSLAGMAAGTYNRIRNMISDRRFKRKWMDNKRG